MNVTVKEGIVLIESDGVVIELIMKDSSQKITDVISVNVKADDIVSEVQNEIDMSLSTVVSGEFVTDAFYGIANNGEKIFISRDEARFNPEIFNSWFSPFLCYSSQNKKFFCPPSNRFRICQNR